MIEDAQFSATEPGSIDDRSVDELIEHDDIVLFEQRANCAERGGVAG